jgi:hypothetical protein
VAPLAGLVDGVADGETLVLMLDPARVLFEGRDRVLGALSRLACPNR